MSLRISMLVVGALLVPTAWTTADLVVYDDKVAWEAAVGGNFSTMDFTGFPENTIITDQYAHLGAIFTQGGFITFTGSFEQDGWGLSSNLDEFILEFDQPMNWLAADHPGFLQYFLYLDGVLVGETSLLGGDLGSFSGVISDEPFDMVIILDPATVPNVDDLHFGPAIPAPAAWVLAVAPLVGRRRRRGR